MRPNQQNRRMRGRGNRKGPNPLTRSYESNGPDVKIRGSAQQIAEKYTTLARDAQGSGDRVIAENYLQHAEHYNRIIAAAQGQQPAQVQRDHRDDSFDDEDDDQNQSASAPERQSSVGSGPQPVINGTPAEVALEEQTLTDEGEKKARDDTAEKKTPRRPRRPRKEAVGDSGRKGGGDNAETGPENDANREKDAALEATGN